ncbi:SMI1/KNR4 family protein [Pseudomonas sp. PDM28]|uniref:SMI1/KNR4 family protein n=1 Tax=Pseudomonas sp. PDM28 TaxID=2854770 RepID=UPI001C45960E|nr:SMI1/KNR4 family protein [Pseudomonas sp. PDM28]MBV7555186.1 SMI1/KNR4 family protein [Pseudomonas sp. PDM28]
MFENINVIGEPRVLSTDAEVDQAQHVLGSQFPTGYREYVTQFGEGILGGVYIRIYPPHQILHGENSQANWLERINQFWFWDDDKELMPKEKALQCIIIGDTYDGDELIIHPEDPERIYVLPRHSEAALVAGHGLVEAIEWLCSSNVLTESFTERDFEPFDSRVEAS